MELSLGLIHKDSEADNWGCLPIEELAWKLQMLDKWHLLADDVFDMMYIFLACVRTLGRWVVGDLS